VPVKLVVGCLENMNQSVNTSEIKIDWVNLPSDIIPISLWDCLHDTELCKIRSDLYDRSVSVDFGIYHILEHRDLPENMKFIFNFKNVKSARVCKYAIWPGKFDRSNNISREDESRLVKEYQSKWREESYDWDSFLKIIENEESNFDISNAEYATNGKELSFRIEGMLNDSNYHVIFIRASNFIIRNSDDIIISIDQFLKFGQDYWDDFSKKEK
jgi:hypothetical protein